MMPGRTAPGVGTLDGTRDYGMGIPAAFPLCSCGEPGDGARPGNAWGG
jgi:hypothetical protein